MPRVQIKKVIAQDFKSYQGRVEIGPFHKNFTSVVGANGSGKSNLIESLLFVFGKKASQMRLKRLSELIHKSSDYQDIHSCFVEVQFEDEKGKMFSLKRTVNQNSVSKYYLDGKEKKLDDIQQLLMKIGIDINNNRFLILQGEVEQISTMAPKSNNQDAPGLLEYLEDIIGSHHFKPQIEELEQQSEQLLETKLRDQNHMRNIQDQLINLEEGKNQAVSYIIKQKNIFQLNNGLKQIQLYKANQQYSESDQKIKQINIELQEEKARQKDHIQKNEHKIKEFNKMKEKLQKIERDTDANQKKLEVLDTQDKKLQQDMTRIVSKEVGKRQMLENLNKQEQKSIYDMDDLQKTLPDLKQQNDKLLEQIQQDSKILEDIKFENRDKTKKLKDQKAQIQNEYQQVEQTQEKLYSQKDSIEKNIKVQENDVKDLENDQISMRQKIIEINQKQQQTKEDLRQFENMKICHKQKLDNTQRQKIQLNQNQHQNENEMNQLKQIIGDIKQNAQDEQIKNEIVGSLKRAQLRKEISGFHGRLGDLGAIDQKYDIAITNVCPQLNNFIVDTVDDAENCITWLKDHKVGRGTFISIEKVKWIENQMNQNFTAPRGTKRLFDLIQFQDKKYRQVFYNALKNTLVCDNIDIATEQGYGKDRFRCVTLDGTVIESSGAMVGSGKPKSGGMGSKIQIDKNDHLRQYQQKLDQYKQKIQQIQDELLQVDGELNELNSDMIEIKKEENNKQIQLNQYNQELSQLQEKERQLEQILNRRSSLNKVELRKQLGVINQQIEQNQKIVDQKKQELNQIDQKIDQISGQQYQDKKKQIEKQQQEQTEMQEKINKIDMQFKTQKKNYVLIQNKLKQEQQVHQEVLLEIQTIKDQIEQIEKDGLNLITKTRELQKQKEALNSDFGEEKKIRDEYEQMIKEVKAQIDLFENQIQEIKLQKKDYEKQCKEFEMQIRENRASYKVKVKDFGFINDQMINEIQGINIFDQEQIQKKVKNNLDIDQILQIDVEQNIPKIQLAELLELKNEIQIKLTFEEERIKQLHPNLTLIQQYQEKYLELKNRKIQFNQSDELFKKKLQEVQDIRKQRQDLFLSGFAIIAQKLKETYQLLTSGGDAALELCDTLDPFSDGVQFSVRPPKKTWKQMNKLSGGEKTLSSLALVFALHYYKPNSVYFMDEIDAALDFKNVNTVGQYIKERTKDAQFIIISLRNHMFELSDQLVGIYKTTECTKTITLSVNED